MELFFNISNKFGNMENHEFLVINMGKLEKFLVVMMTTQNQFMVVHSHFLVVQANAYTYIFLRVTLHMAFMKYNFGSFMFFYVLVGSEGNGHWNCRSIYHEL